MNLCSNYTYGCSEAGLLLGRCTGHVAEMAWRTLGQNTLENVYQYFVQTGDLDKNWDGWVDECSEFFNTRARVIAIFHPLKSRLCLTW